MMRFIRWQGLVAFVVLTALVSLLLYFFAETLVKKAIISSGEAIFAAEVNVKEVQLNYSPLQLTVFGLQVTDRERPEQNVFSLAQATASVEILQYLFGKIIVDELTVSQLAFASVRSQPGAVYKNSNPNLDTSDKSIADTAKEMLPEIDMKLPDVDSLLNDSNLLTVKASKALQATYATEQAKLKALKAQLPSKTKLKSYQDKVTALGNSKVESVADIEKIKLKFERIKAEFKADQAIVEKAKQQVLSSKAVLGKQFEQLKSAPNRDWQQIEEKYQLESVDAGDFAHILFGQQARGYLQKAQWAYQKILPFIGNINTESTPEQQANHAKGRFIFFKEEEPLPAILIKKALFSINTAQGVLTVNGSELTHQHWLRNKASKLDVNSTTHGELRLTSHFKFSKSGEFDLDGSWSISQRPLTKVNLTKSDQLTVLLEKALLNGEGNFTFIHDEITASNHLSLHEASYQGQAKAKLSKLLLDTIKTLDTLTVDVDVKGQIDDANFSITSSLNDALTGAFKQQVAGKLTEFKQQVNNGLNEKLADALKIGDSNNAELVNFEGLLMDTDKALDDLQNSDLVKQQQQKLENRVKDKVKDKLKDKLGDLFG
ncbi:TIGR03545 family protein [Colwelliaceae bacterium MEBiC 14330]